MKVIVILFQDIRIEGVEAVVAIPKGKTAEQTYKTWLTAQAAKQGQEDQEEVSPDDIDHCYQYDEYEVE